MSAISLDALIAGEPAALAIVVLSLVVAVIIAGVILGGSKTAMNKDNFQDFKLIKKEIISHDSRKFTFALQTPTTLLGLPIGQHITLKFTGADGRGVQRSYTPVTGDETPGSVAFVIKVYKANVHPKFPNGGKLSLHLDSLKLGDTIEMKGPKGHLEYLGNGNFTVTQMRKPMQSRHAKHFGLIAGGTGITPCLQIINAVLKDPENSSITLSMIYANQTEDDILLRNELEELAAANPERFKLHHTLDRPPKKWAHSEGFVTKEMIAKHIPAASADGSTQVLMCGPPPMIKFACLPALKELGFKDDSYFSF